MATGRADSKELEKIFLKVSSIAEFVIKAVANWLLLHLP